MSYRPDPAVVDSEGVSSYPLPRLPQCKVGHGSDAWWFASVVKSGAAKRSCSETRARLSIRTWTYVMRRDR